MSKPNPQKRKSENEGTALNQPAKKTRAKFRKDPNQNSTTSSETENKAKRNPTVAEKRQVAKAIAALDEQNTRIATQIIRRGVPSLLVSNYPIYPR